MVLACRRQQQPSCPPPVSILRLAATSTGKSKKPRDPMPATPEDLTAFLAEIGVSIRTVSHPPLFTVGQSRALRGETAGAHTKNLFLKDKKGALYLIVAEESTAIDLKRLHTRIGAAGRLSFGKPEELYESLGVAPGAASVFGLINDRDRRVSVVLDAGLMASETVNCHPLINTATTSIGADDLLIFVKATGHEPLILALDEPAAAAKM
jgi:Ala-tRNA(Pro) deacylase